jgi:ribonuclease BN (tRNA processing enzyme)
MLTRIMMTGLTSLMAFSSASITFATCTLDMHNTLLWAGEGSYGQLVRRYGAAGAQQVVSNLGAVWISHIHADHHAGLPRLLAVSFP